MSATDWTRTHQLSKQYQDGSMKVGMSSCGLCKAYFIIMCLCYEDIGGEIQKTGYINNLLISLCMCWASFSNMKIEWLVLQSCVDGA